MQRESKKQALWDRSLPGEDGRSLAYECVRSYLDRVETLPPDRPYSRHGHMRFSSGLARLAHSATRLVRSRWLSYDFLLFAHMWPSLYFTLPITARNKLSLFLSYH